jgi:hypothetical protein
VLIYLHKSSGREASSRLIDENGRGRADAEDHDGPTKRGRYNL